jgi:hypothetical protein
MNRYAHAEGDVGRGIVVVVVVVVAAAANFVVGVCLLPASRTPLPSSKDLPSGSVLSLDEPRQVPSRYRSPSGFLIQTETRQQHPLFPLFALTGQKSESASLFATPDPFRRKYCHHLFRRFLDELPAPSVKFRGLGALDIWIVRPLPQV